MLVLVCNLEQAFPCWPTESCLAWSRCISELFSMNFYAVDNGKFFIYLFFAHEISLMW